MPPEKIGRVYYYLEEPLRNSVLALRSIEGKTSDSRVRSQCFQICLPCRSCKGTGSAGNSSPSGQSTDQKSAHTAASMTVMDSLCFHDSIST